MRSPGNFARRNLARILPAFLLAPSFAALSGCASLQQSLSKAVLMDYDQTSNFRQFDMQQDLPWRTGSWETGIVGWTSGSPVVNGFWATFIICNVRNEGSAAANFPFKMENFYVTYDGQNHFYKPLAPYTFSSYPNNVPANPKVTPQVNQYFRQATNLGPENDTFQKNTYAPSVNYRFAIYVIKTSPGVVPTDMPLSLRYKNYPNIMNNRNQLPQTKSTPTKKADLATVCRPPA